MGLEIAFWVLAGVGVIAALAVVILRDVFRAALSMILCFLVVAGIYVTLSADFLAAVQVGGTFLLQGQLLALPAVDSGLIALQFPATHVVAAGHHAGTNGLGYPHTINEVADFGLDLHQITGVHANATRVDGVQPNGIDV